MRTPRVDRDLALREARQRATQVLARHGLTDLPIDPFVIATERRIVIHRVNGLSRGQLGHIDYCEGGRIEISLSADYDNQGLINFTLGHELGHFHIDGHFDLLFADGCTRHESRGGFTTLELYEQQADAFASELLMPRAACERVLGNLSPDDAGLKMILALAERCQTSVHATANRYVDLADRPAAIIVSVDGLIEYCARSKHLMDMHERKGTPGLFKGAKLPLHSLATRLHSRPELIARADRPQPTEVRWRHWFGAGEDPVCEEAIGLGSYGKVITVLTANDWSEDEDDNDNDKEWDGRDD